MSKAAVQPIPFSSEAIGVRTFRFIDQNRNRPVAVELWYPVSSSFPVSDESADAVWIHPREARDAPLPSGSRFPLILMSHGHKGDRRERSWLADTLVRQGYIVAAVEHFGNTWNQYNALLSMCFWERARDVSFTLDALLGDPSLAKILDPAKVGFVGYSLGGMTGLALAGAVAKNTRELARQKSQALAGEAVPPEAIGLFDFDAAERSYKEPRIHSMLLICPANFLYPPESLRQITIPVGLVAAINDEVLPYKEHAYQIIKHLVPHKLKLMRKEISHYTFLNRVTEAGRKILDKAIQNDPPCCDKASVHREVGIFAVEFFKETLK
jgi:predicted dienelactone hydrolase